MKKVIALIVAATIIITALNISAFATSEPSAMTSQEYYAAQSDLIDKFCNGDITYSQFQEQSQAVTNDYITANTVGGVLQSGALTASNNIAAVSKKIGATVDKWGDSARDRVSDWWNDICNKHNVPTKETQTSTTDFMGYGAKIEYYTNGKLTSVYFCDYMTVYPDYPPSQNNIRTNGVISCYSVNSNGSLKFDYNLNAQSWYRYPADTSGVNFCKFYGDIRYSDGTPAPSDDVFEYGTLKNFDDMPAKDIEDLLDDFSEEMERQNPDLSSIEGLLNAIYARMGTLDSDDDNGLLSQINTSILSLNSSISDLSTSIETSINDLKETITSLLTNEDKKDDDNKTETEKHEIAGTLYNVIPLEKNWIQKITHDKTNLHVEYQGKDYYLESDGTLKLGDKYYYVDMNYSSTLDEILYTLLDIRDSLELLTEEEKQMSFGDFFDLKVSDFKLDLDEKFAFKDNLKTFLNNFFEAFESSVPKYNGG